jgi:polyisoprenoid-binding protein YceI
MTTHPITDQTQDKVAETRWRLDPSASNAEFRVPHLWGLVTVKGHFERLEGQLDVDENQQRGMKLTIDAASLQTGNRKRDKHLRSGDLFDAQNHPELQFRSTRVTDAGDGRLRVEGDSRSPASAWHWTSKPPSSKPTTSWTSKPARPSTSASWA